jgi:hypothetical protein
VHVVDADGDGEPDPHWLFEGTTAPDGAYAIWPRIYLEYMGASEGGDADADASYIAEVFVFPDFLLTGEVPVGVPVPRNTLTAQFAGQVLRVPANGEAEVVSGADIPAGDWAVTLVSETGQTWTLPNATAGAPSTDPDWDPAAQAGHIVMQ